MNSNVRWGIISTAKIARQELLPAIRDAKNAVVTAIASSNAKVHDIASRFGIPKIYESYNELLEDPDIDAVYIPLPNNLHAEWVKRAAEKGKHILCEKPAALTSRETEEMVRVCEKNSVIFMEAFMYQFHPQHTRVKDIISSGKIGDLKIMKASFSFFLGQLEGNIRMDPSMGGGSLYDIGCYCIHAIRNILGTEPESVFVSAQTKPGSEVDMSVTGIMNLKNGMTALFDAGMDRTQRNNYEIVGTKGSVRVNRAFTPQLFNGEAYIESEIGDVVRKERIVGHQYINQIEHFSQCILDGTVPMYTPENSIQNMKVIEACYESIKAGTFVKVP